VTAGHGSTALRPVRHPSHRGTDAGGVALVNRSANDDGTTVSGSSATDASHRLESARLRHLVGAFCWPPSEHKAQYRVARDRSNGVVGGTCWSRFAPTRSFLPQTGGAPRALPGRDGHDRRCSSCSSRRAAECLGVAPRIRRSRDPRVDQTDGGGGASLPKATANPSWSESGAEGVEITPPFLFSMTPESESTKPGLPPFTVADSKSTMP